MVRIRVIMVIKWHMFRRGSLRVGGVTMHVYDLETGCQGYGYGYSYVYDNG